MSDPFDALALPAERQEPRPAFARDLRRRLVERLGLDPDDPAALPVVDLPQRRGSMPTTTTTPTATSTERTAARGGIWPIVCYEDALAGIRFLEEVFGFEEELVVVDDDGRTVRHSELRGPDGGIVQASTFDPGNVFLRGLPPGAQSIYVVTADPHGIWARCQAAGVEVVREPESADYDPDGMGFSVRDPEGNVWSFGTYGLASG